MSCEIVVWHLPDFRIRVKRSLWQDLLSELRSKGRTTTRLAPPSAQAKLHVYPHPSHSSSFILFINTSYRFKARQPATKPTRALRNMVWRDLRSSAAIFRTRRSNPTPLEIAATLTDTSPWLSYFTSDTDGWSSRSVEPDCL